MTATDDHGTLPGHADRLLARLDSLHERFGPSNTTHLQHHEHAERARLLADLLRGVQAAATDRRYAAAFVVVRTALEHHLLDRLLFLANRWIVKYGGVRKAQLAAEEQKLAGLKAGPRPDIVRWRHDPQTGSMNVVIKGHLPGRIGRPGRDDFAVLLPGRAVRPFHGGQEARRARGQRLHERCRGP